MHSAILRLKRRSRNALWCAGWGKSFIRDVSGRAFAALGVGSPPSSRFIDRCPEAQLLVYFPLMIHLIETPVPQTLRVWLRGGIHCKRYVDTYRAISIGKVI
ncbi:hypothetical protein A2673_02570 [Candidatus Kaiserbacteria bacterium RIFCSPHIGHO2_01_FULL_50_13]|uniref:Uncharacterized protein n=1 Tax=Candidatus Kaiserbacteria bacterium RIFCSPLOWO2_01_FULL_50_24 TaxID=1798507 RepID=A0A1F6EMZ9_9BACT|nr:MAG: hypothetical protein A2673_02570 [Candidatus Kaiserbacteria bacterium RIFCSPHIGHO2_01_FULL_50_13]OGG75026.1 MAG: hypothetical protein A3A34_00920 [Candidatus Kaiserbacteria bacterium RIFCSPLOWO2_01_FULL_50_24]OGG81666.1 MAG: hypothetical protein A3H74_02255 [Candidatus Kaiserbacteria bacterium RIFCSPLOWO2_02_FULL_51_13]